MSSSPHLATAYKCTKCSFLNAAEPSNGACSAWFGCGFAKGQFVQVQIPVQTLRSIENKKAEEEASNVAWGVIWLAHAALVFFKKGAAYGFASLFFGPFVWFF